MPGKEWMVALCSGWHIITLHNSRTLFSSFQVREFSAHYYSSSEIRGGEGGESFAFSKGMFERWRGLSFFKLVGEWCRLNLLFRENEQSKHWRTWPGQPTEQERYCRSASLNQCSSLLGGDGFQKHLDYNLKGLSHRYGSHTEMLLYCLPTCIVCYISRMVNKCLSWSQMRLTFTPRTSWFLCGSQPHTETQHSWHGPDRIIKRFMESPHL